MRVLYLCHRIPYPPNKGDKIRAFHQVQAMAARHEVDLFTLADEAADLDHRGALLRHCRQVTVARLNPLAARLRALPHLFSGRPLTVPYFYSPELDREIGQALRRRAYDRIFVYCSAMAQYVEKVEGVPLLMDFVDADSDKWTQYAAFARFPFSAIYRREGRCLREYERRLCRQASCVIVTTEREADILRQTCPAAHLRVIPNGVDLDYFSPRASAASAAGPAVTFTGDMSYFPNQQAVTTYAQKIHPLVRRAVPDARFLIVGRNPSPDVRRLGSIPGVEVTGLVPDVRAYLARARVAVAPFSIAAGVQNKILEALAWGLPVVAAPRVLQGLSPAVGEIVDTAEAAEDFAAKVSYLLQHPEAARNKGVEGRRRVGADYDWGRSMAALLALLENPAQEPRGARAAAAQDVEVGR